MSGHSKWSSIKHKKGAADAKRGKLFSKLARGMIVAAKEGGGDPDNNLALANAKGAGSGANSKAFEASVYEGYGPEGVAVIGKALTDNRNRTASEVRHI